MQAEGVTLYQGQSRCLGSCSIPFKMGLTYFVRHLYIDPQVVQHYHAYVVIVLHLYTILALAFLTDQKFLLLGVRGFLILRRAYLDHRLVCYCYNMPYNFSPS